MNSIGELIETEEYQNAWQVLLGQAQQVQSYAEFASVCRWREKLVDKAANPNVRKAVKMALLGGATTKIMFAVIAFFSVLLTVPEVHMVAAVLLSLGLAVQTTRQVIRRVSGFQLIVRRTLIPMMLLISGLAVTFQGFRWIAEQQLRRDLPTAAPKAVNLLVVVLDTVRAQNLSLYGYTRSTTPRLEHWAKTGVLFQQAFSTAPWTLPSHVVLG